MSLKDLQNFFEVMQFHLKDLADLHDEAVKFLNRSLEKDYYLNSSEADQFALRTVVFPGILRSLWFHYTGSVKDSLRIMGITTFMKEMDMSKTSSIIMIGRGGPSSDEALYAAWKIFPTVRDNLYLILMHTTGHYDYAAYLYEGDINEFFSHKKMGLVKSWDDLVAKQPELFEQSGTEFEKVLKLKTTTDIGGFGDVYTNLRNNGIIAW
jgi:hypothetical protein